MTWITRGFAVMSRRTRPVRQKRLLTTTKMTGVQVTHTPSLQQQHDNDTPAALVDGLLQYTQQLMEDSNTTHHVVAYSGGVDSSLVTALLQQACSWGDHSVQAVLGVSPAVSQEQIHQARQVALHLQVDLQEIPTTEASSSVYIENRGQACFACKTHLYDALSAIHQHHSSQRQHVQLYNGTNRDDLQDSTRVGLIAASNFNVSSPLQYTTKENVRRAAKCLGLPNWNAAASPCLRSRLALGMEATRSHLYMIEQAEVFVKNLIRAAQGVLHPAANIRVRMLTNKRAMIEVDADLLPYIQVGTVEMQEYFQSLGFSSVSAREFRTGSVAAKRPVGEHKETTVDTMAGSQLVEAAAV